MSIIFWVVVSFWIALLLFAVVYWFFSARKFTPVAVQRYNEIKARERNNNAKKQLMETRRRIKSLMNKGYTKTEAMKKEKAESEGVFSALR